MSKRVFLIVLDSFGIGEAPDAASFGDFGVNTLAHMAGSPAFHAPNLAKLGLFNMEGVGEACGIAAEPSPIGAVARLREKSAGKDTTIGHWEIAGLVSEKPLPTYPEGFPEEVLAEFTKRTGYEVLCNKPYSGTAVIRDYGEEHLRTGALIVYTSADSVLQIAAHEEKVPLPELYRVCETAREMLVGMHGVGRVIARPFVGTCAGDFTRTAGRHDYSLLPPGPTLLTALKDAGKDVIGVGKIYDIFAGQGLDAPIRTEGNADGMQKTLEIAAQDFEGLCFVNLVDFDMLYGHRRDVDGYAAAISAFDAWLPSFMEKMGPADLLMITADHGCDPAYTATTDHTREYVPLLVYGAAVEPGLNLGTVEGFDVIASTICEYLGVDYRTLCGESRLMALTGRNYVITGTVVAGKQLGRTVGMPTANLAAASRSVLPADGVYCTRVTLQDGSTRLGVTNFGTRPSVDSSAERTIETLILDFEGDLYGQEMTVEVLSFLRGIHKFANLDAVKRQVQQDAETCRRRHMR